MQVYNTLTRKKEEFVPLEKGKIKMYLCGPTVYDLGHLGHARSAVAFDIIRKYLIYKGYKVKFVSNYTDIEDKMINRANELNIEVKELAEKIIPEYAKDYFALGINAPDIQPKATEYIPQIIKMVEGLLEKGVAYKTKDGIYFDISRFPEYGKLSNQNPEELKSGARVKIDKNKKHPHDFVLWKKSKEGEPSWDSPFGKGRPGWHIECSAMNLAILGETIDIHAGGTDLIFPHHEDEIAQSEAFTGKTFAKYWLHNGFIKIDNEKMSKSLGNFFTIQDILKKYDAKVVRYLLISTHYRSPINFTHELLDQAKESLQRVHDFVINLKNFSSSKKSNPQIKQLIEKTKKKLEKSMDNDFEAPQALAAIFEMIKETNLQKDNLSTNDTKNILKLLKNFDQILGVLFPEEKKLPKEIEKLIQERENAREEKDFKKADEIRDKLQEKGIELEDTNKGTIWKMNK